MAEWPTPTTRKQFLGFANFYRRFIQGDKAHLHASLLCLNGGRGSILQAQGTVHHCTCLVSSRPSFAVHGRGGRLGCRGLELSSHRSTSDDRLHPCAFFSKHLSPAEWNYDVGNRKLLALVLQEWRHWLEGAAEPYIVWTDHKNLAYLRGAKQLNSRQAQWALFLGQCEFVLTYRTGSKNVKPDALSHQFSTDPSNRDPELIPSLHRWSSNLACGDCVCEVQRVSVRPWRSPAKYSVCSRGCTLPRDIVSDRGLQFMSQVWEAFCKPLRATASLCSGYHSQSNGQTERANQGLETTLRCVAAPIPAAWSFWLP